MKKCLLIYCFLAPLVVFSQSLSIAELWKYQGSSSLHKERTLKKSIALSERSEAMESWLPVFYGDAGLQHNIVIPTTPVPSIAFDPNAAPGSITPLRFATKWSSKAGVQLEWKIFDPLRSKEMKIKNLQVQKTELENQEMLHNWKKDATLAYTSVVLASLQYEQYRQDSIHYSHVLASIKERAAEGRALASEYLEAQQEMERIKIRRIEAWGVLSESSLLLLDEVPNLSIHQLTSGLDEIVGFLHDFQHPNFKQLSLQTDLQIAKQQLLQEQAQRWPSLSLQSYYGAQYYDNSLRLGAWDQWFGNSYAAISLRIPLSEHFYGTATSKKNKLQLQLNLLQLETQTSDDVLRDTQIQIKHFTSAQKVNHLQEILNLATENADIQYSAFQEGRILLSDFHLALLSQTQAQQNVWQAQYEWVEALLN